MSRKDKNDLTLKPLKTCRPEWQESLNTAVTTNQLITEHVPFISSSSYKTLPFVYRRALLPLLVNMHTDRLVEMKQGREKRQLSYGISVCVLTYIYLLWRDFKNKS